MTLNKIGNPRFFISTIIDFSFINSNLNRVNSHNFDDFKDINTIIDSQSKFIISNANSF